MYFFSFFFVLFPSGSINVHGAFFTESLCLMEKEKARRKKKHLAALLIHFTLEPVGALLYQEGLHMNTLIGTRRSGWRVEEDKRR